MSKELIKVKTMEPKNRLRIEYMAGDTCNYRCAYCGPNWYGGSRRWPKDIEALLKNFRHLLDFYVSNKIDEFEINILGGEPTLWPELAYFSRELKKDYNIKLTITSNGSRTMRWWEKNADAFDKILFSYHYKEADIDHYINVLDLVYSKGIPLNCLFMMDPDCWDECIDAIEYMKSNSKYSWFISAMEVHPPKYNDEQRKFLNDHVKRRPPIYRVLKDEYKNIIKGKTTVFYDDGSKQKVNRNFFSLNQLNSFEGWMCNIGIEVVNIKKDGRITGTCENKVFGQDDFYNIYDVNFTETFNPKLVPSICERKKCWCQPEMLMTKWKI